MEQNKDQSSAITLERAGFKLASHVATPGGPIMVNVTDVYEKDDVQLIHSYAMGGESWSIGAAVRGEAVAKCTVPPIGWRCTRIAGHEGPCAAYPIDEAAEKYEAEMLEVIDQRDKYHDMADQLAAQIAAMTEVDIGEHSSANEPWRNALIAGDEFIAAKFKAFCNGPVSARAADAPSEPSVKMLSGALNHARDTLRFYAEQEHFVRHQPDSWDAVSGEPQSLYEDASNTATVEDGTLAKNTLNDIAGVEAYASVAADALDSQPSTDEPTDRESLIACLGDDAVTLLRANPDDEMAQTMREAAAMLENDGKVLESQPTRPSPADAPPLKFRTLLEQCMVVLADAGWRSSPPIAGLRNLYEQIEKALTMEALDSQPTDFEDRPLKARVLRNELAIIIGCQDGRTGAEKADAVLNWIETQGQHVFVSASSQPTEGDGCDECRHTYCLSGEICRHCGDVNGTQGWKGGRQPTDGGVRNG